MGEVFESTVVERRGDRAVVQLDDPAVTAACEAPHGPGPGERLSLVLEHADIRSGSIGFRPVDAVAAAS